MSASFYRLGRLPIFPAVLGIALLVPPALAQDYGRPVTSAARGDVYVAQAPAQASQQKAQYEVARSAQAPDRARQILAQRNPNEHPLMPCLRWAYDGIAGMERINDYQATMVKREQINGKLGDYEHMFVKIRHKPFSVYMYFLAPEKKKGQEAIYRVGENNGKMLAHGVGLQRMLGTLPLDPTGQIAMTGNRYPITEIGMVTMVRRLIEVAEQDVKYGECEVQYFPNTKVNDRVCTCIRVVHPTPRRNFRFHIAQIFVDDELNLPIRYVSYDWPEKPGGTPQLLEEYTYVNLKLNNGFTDGDFDVKNPNYQFESRK